MADNAFCPYCQRNVHVECWNTKIQQTDLLGNRHDAWERIFPHCPYCGYFFKIGRRVMS